MKSFEELEKEHQQTLVQLDDAHSKQAEGLLQLQQDTTEVRLSTSERFQFSVDENGWFDLRLRENSGAVILLQDAISLGRRRYFGSASKRVEERIFPNIVVFGADHLSDDALVKTITFSFPGIEQFFFYPYFDDVVIQDQSADLVDKLFSKKRDGLEVFRPVIAFLANLMPDKLMEFEIEDRCYSVSSLFGYSATVGTKLEAFNQPVAKIDYQSSVTINDALEDVWTWKRFFEQVAFTSLSVNKLSVRSEGMEPYAFSDIYLPNVSLIEPEIHPGDVPLNMWKERADLAETMKSWLLIDRKRQLFRTSVSQVINSSKKRVSLNDVVMLCAGLESLSELEGEIQISKKQRKDLTKAVQAEIEKQNIKIPTGRIANLFGQLNMHSLRSRLEMLVKALRLHISQKDGKLVVNEIIDFRNMAGHGKIIPELVRPKAAPVIQTLLACCVLYDLTTNKIPIRWRNGQQYICAIRIVIDAISELKRLNTKIHANEVQSI